MHGEKLTFAEVEEFYKFRGVFIECMNSINRGDCVGCCEGGSVLFPGEDDFLLSKQTQGLISQNITIGKPNGDEYFNVIKNCFGLSCRLGDFKPIACRLFPLIGVYPRSGLISSEEEVCCFAFRGIPPKFREEAKVIREKLKRFMLSEKEIETKKPMIFQN